MTKKQKEILAQLNIYKEGAEISNPFTGQSCHLDGKALAIYDYVKGCESLNQSELADAITIFRELYPKEYMILLD